MPSEAGQMIVLGEEKCVLHTNSWFTVINTFISNFDILPLISQSDIVNIHELTLILEIIGQCNVKQIMMLQLKTIRSVLKV